jgi:hypothetical protein
MKAEKKLSPKIGDKNIPSTNSLESERKMRNIDIKY